MYIYIYETIWFAVEIEGALGQSFWHWTLAVTFPWAQSRPFAWALVGPSQPSKARLARSDASRLVTANCT